ncbi:hypothetical protein FIBSPDRAFT_959371 [Athelia psychrophila]|uniref:Uncharacterized protein n=1 Tax=Athelia psychrophila TaxID=1759441 RepID=A0A166DJC3_9AGAM|nr:hypothetical protein FIBSPDRAFT_959371 [Fibularhizoctonia sp. CBS 109695]
MAAQLARGGNLAAPFRESTMPQYQLSESPSRSHMLAHFLRPLRLRKSCACPSSSPGVASLESNQSQKAPSGATYPAVGNTSSTSCVPSPLWASSSAGMAIIGLSRPLLPMPRQIQSCKGKAKAKEKASWRPYGGESLAN